MTQLKSGNFRSDFRINGKRYQPVWDVDTKKEALMLEKEFKESIKSSKRVASALSNVGLDYMIDPMLSAEPENRMKLSEVRDWMQVRYWDNASDSKNPPNRMNRLIEILGDIYINDVSNASLETIRSWCKDKGKANKTLNNYLSVLSVSLKKLEETGTIILQKPLRFNVYKEKIVGGREVCFTKSEETMMLDTLKQIAKEKPTVANLEMVHFFIVESNLGLRPSEFFALQIGDINFKEKSVTIRRGVRDNSTKNGVVRTLPIDGSCYDSLLILALNRGLEITRGSHSSSQSYSQSDKLNEVLELTVSDLKREELCEELLDLSDSPLVRRTTVSKLSPKMVERRWKEMRERLGWTDKKTFKEYTPYGLRHTVASRLAGERKLGAHIIQKFMGHTDIATSQKYVHLNVNDLMETVGLGA